jgi:glycosyltransferase involved in cell wall biosynthesis
MRIHIFYNENSGCDYHRLLLPACYMPLSENDTIQYFKHSDSLTRDDVFNCDILFINRMFIVDFKKIEWFKQKYGFKVVVDIDDYNQLPPNHIYYNSWQQNQMEGRIAQACTNADYVFVTNEQLYNVYKKLNTNIEIIPNALPFNNTSPLLEPIESEYTRFLYVAGSSHYNDLRSIKGCLERLGSDSYFRQKARFILCGYENPTNDPKNIWHSIESLAKITKAYVRRGSMALSDYITHYTHGDVAIAPLEYNFFNTCKSNLKFIEAARMHKPFICSDTLPYTIDKNKTSGITYCSNSRDWYKAFKFFIKNKNLIKDLGEKNYQYAKNNYNIETTNQKRLQIFNSL